MNQFIQVGARREFQSKTLWEMHRLRARIFRERMGWEVSLLGGMEIDGYDALDPHYMVIREGESVVRGCWRMLPTEGPYMLRDTFPELLHGQAAPEAPDVWELSRFAIETEGPQGFGFAGLALEAMREIVTFGDRMGIKHYVTVTTTPIERLLRKTGIAITRYGPPIRIGVENAVALDIDIGEKTHLALFGDMAKAA
ncbi:MAG: GNAT family N-acetyltransferase [Rhodocyclaceae bacterium]|nr:GNAT family N-acetyltransferase [Rhodocyclaceae bacterium]